MERIININLQGRVIPIEESAYDSLKKYIDSLRVHFAKEEGNDEIVNDIENRIAELLSYRLKQGAPCISISDLNTVINNIGRLEDIEAAEGEEPQPRPAAGPASQPDPAPLVRGRFYRNADDKVIAGVCSGIANRIGVDPVIVRILFVLLLGAFFWIYILMWIIVPSQSVRANVTRRLYRNPEDRVIAGVCGGLAVYFNTASWVPRLIFIAPLLLGILSRSMYALWWHWSWGMGPRIFMGSFGSSLFLLYVILWIALPYASSATDMLEMRGEKIDIHSIKAASQAGSGTFAPRRRSGLGHVLGILFKAFFIFIAGTIAVSFFGVLIGLMFGSFVALPFSAFLLHGWIQYTLAAAGIILFLGIPMLALVTWIIRRLIGIRTHRHYLGFIFAALWVAGFISIMALAGIMVRNFSSRSIVEEARPMQQPTSNKLYVNVINKEGPEYVHHHYRWIDSWDDENGPFRIVNKDSLWLNNIKVEVTQSTDSLYHLYVTRISRGESPEEAKEMATHIAFNIGQQDSIINLPGGFTISNKDRFHNQQVLVTVEVPPGKDIQLSKDIDDYSWYNINGHRGRYFYMNGDWEGGHHHWRHWQYRMTPMGLQDQDSTTSWSGDDHSDDEDEVNED